MLRKSKVLSKLRAGSFARICATGHFLPFFVRYAAHYGYDGIWFDLEHRAMDAREVQSFIALCRLHDIDCMVRPATRERTLLYRYLEDGAAGFMFPFVSTAAEARRLVDYITFPPMGDRGLDGAGLDGDYGIEVWKPGSDYIEHANNETFILAQIETPEAVRNVDEIAAVPGIDILFVGTADLGLRLAHLKESERYTLDEGIARVAAACKKHGKAWGLPTGTPEATIRYRDMGAKFIVRGGDFALAEVLRQNGKELDELQNRPKP
jgi:2-keto-3-deoxy-L-rhamnonate aldolase RhmA